MHTCMLETSKNLITYFEGVIGPRLVFNLPGDSFD